MMDDKKKWLEKVLDDASAEVESWPDWLKDREIECREHEKGSPQVNGLAREAHQSKEGHKPVRR
jgi:hypothetical protein